MILHIITRKEWLEAQKSGEYLSPSLELEGFIHCSTEKQIAHVANAFYSGKKGLMLLVIDETRLKSKVEWEAPPGPPVDGISQSDRFPHVYGPINADAVASVLEFEPDSAGTFTPPRLP